MTPVLSHASAATLPAVQLWDRVVLFSNRVGERILHAINRLIARASVLPEQPFYDPAGFPWVHDLEANWKVIRRELDDVLAYHSDLPNFQDISTDQASLTDDDRWKTYFFYGYGFKSEPNCARCPETTRLVESVPGMETAMFSILSAGKHLPPHTGPYKGVLRYHLGFFDAGIMYDPSSLCSRHRAGIIANVHSMIAFQPVNELAWAGTLSPYAPPLKPTSSFPYLPCLMTCSPSST